MDLLDVLRAKSEDKDTGILLNEDKDNTGILLKNHLYLTVERAIQLKRFITNNRSVLSYDRLDDKFFRSLYIACLLHDLGKINLDFQKKLYRKEDESSIRTIRDFFKGYANIHVDDHEVISILYSLVFLSNDEWDKKIRTAILLHHYNDFYANKEISARYLFDEYPDLSEYLKFMLCKKEEIKRLLESLLNYIKERLEREGGDLTNEISEISQLFQELAGNMEKGYDQIDKLYEAYKANRGLSEILKFYRISDEDSNHDIYDFFVFLGALRRCDYAASANINIEEYSIQLSRVYSELNKRISKKIGSGSGKIWQEELIDKIDMAKSNIVLIAPTGSGKTEFALLWASKKGKKLIYTLPLRVALNDLYWRFTNNVNNGNGYFDSNHLNILHSTSFIEYIKVREDGKEGRYGMADVGIKYNTAKLFSTPILLTTPDQVFLTSLKYYSFDKLINVYPLSTIIIDEVQAYKPEMVAIILKTIEIIQRLQGDIIIITATFPPYLEEFIKDKFDIIDVSEYVDIKGKVKNYNQKRHLISLIQYSLFNQNNPEITHEGLECIKEQLNKNKDKNILIIVNNVKKAIRLYEELKKINNEDVYLLHSRLLEKEKSSRISSIKVKKEKSKRIVLVATQIVEASVDIDFDLLITEISPIDSQIQRWGRIYRNRNANYTSPEPNILIFTKYDKGTTAIYDEDVIKQTKCVLTSKEGKTFSYEDEISIIKEVYNTIYNGSKTLKDIYIEKIKEHLEYLKYFTAEKKSHAQRLFREIAGLQIIVPAIMSKSENKIESKFGELIEDENNNLSWNEIINKIREETGSDNVDEWYLKHILYEYSTNLPFFLLKKLPRKGHIFEIKEFKGYYALVIKDTKDRDAIIGEIKEYGLDKALERVEVDTYESEIEVSENII